MSGHGISLVGDLGKRVDAVTKSHEGIAANHGRLERVGYAEVHKVPTTPDGP